MTKDIRKIYDEIAQDIITFKIRPGEKIGEIEMAERYQVSRTPIRDVFKRLAYGHLVEIRSQSGTYVTKIDLSGVEDIMFIRSAVEYQVLSDLMGKLTEEDFSFLEEALKEMQAMALTLPEEKKQDFAERFFALDNDFHRYLYRKDGKEETLLLLNETYPAFQRYRFLTFLRDDPELENFCAAHEKLIQVLKNQDEENLSAAVHVHNYSGLVGIEKVIAKYPEYFSEASERK